MLFPPGLLRATILSRRGRFSVNVRLEDGATGLAYLANSGRLQGLLEPGTPALLCPRPGERRLLPWDLLLVAPSGGDWVAVDARLANRLLYEALTGQGLRALQGYTHVRAEVVAGGSRMDFLLTGPAGRCLVEAKSVTLVRNGVALFPDAPTDRGRRQLHDLVQARREGLEAAVVFVVQREDASSLQPNRALDPAFAAALYQAAGAGVALLAYRCHVCPQGVALADRIPVRL